MLRIDCPFCGARDETEFRCAGQSHLTRPGPPDQVSDAEWGDYLYLRDNPRGWHRERWHHIHGCRQWFNVVRHTLTHEIRAVYTMGASPPALDPSGGRA